MSVGPDWANRLLALRNRETHEDSLEFVNLVDQAIGHADEATIRTLLLTYGDDPDYGVQESVNRVLLGHMPPRSILEPFLDLLPEMSTHAGRWLSTILGQLVKRIPGDVVTAVRERNGTVQQIVVEVVSRPYFIELYDNAESVRRALSADSNDRPSPNRGQIHEHGASDNRDSAYQT